MRRFLLLPVMSLTQVLPKFLDLRPQKVVLLLLSQVHRIHQPSLQPLPLLMAVVRLQVLMRNLLECGFASHAAREYSVGSGFLHQILMVP